MIKCRWCLIVSSDTKSEKLRDDLALNNITNFSVVPPNSDTVWNHLTSAMELHLIEILRGKKKTLKSSDSIFEDVETVLRRIEKCSDFPEIKNENESHDIPQSIKDYLERCIFVILLIFYLSLFLSLSLTIYYYLIFKQVLISSQFEFCM